MDHAELVELQEPMEPVLLEELEVQEQYLVFQELRMVEEMVEQPKEIKELVVAVDTA